MVTGSLTNKMRRSGATLTRLLDESSLSPRASLWLYEPELNAWRLVFGIDEVDRTGPRKVYKQVRSLLSRNRKLVPDIDLKDVSVVSPKSGLVAGLRVSLGIRRGTSGVRVSRDTVNGHYIEDAFVYRLS